MEKSDVDRVQHMLDAAKKIVEFTQDVQRADLDRNEMLSLSVVRLIEIIGEAAKHVSIETRRQYPNVPWRQICGMRDRLVHAYYKVDLDVVWGVAARDLPETIPELERILGDLK